MKKLENIIKINKIVLKYFIASLHKSKKAQKYLLSRLNKSIIEKTYLGYAPYSGLIDVLNKNNISAEDAQALGLIARNVDGFYEVFRNRMMIPIFNNGIIVGFSGRTIVNSKTKYINSKSSFLYNKSETLYCLDFSKKNIVKRGCCFLVEGQFDVLGLMQNGITNVVASCGTAFKNTHARLLKRWTNKVYVCFDGDSAGRGATKKVKEILKKEKIFGGAIRLPDEYDPFSFIEKFGKRKFLCIG